MITGKNIGIAFRHISLFILLSCSKSDQSKPKSNYILNTFTYTFTDTTGINHTFPDSSWQNPDDGQYYLDPGQTIHPSGPVAFLSSLVPDTNVEREFNFHSSNKALLNVYDTTTSLVFYLPYFQASLSNSNNFRVNSLVLELKSTHSDVYYVATPTSSNLGVGTVYLASFTISTNISDSSGGYLTGSFHISATTVDSGKLAIAGKFAHIPTSHRP